MQKTDKNCFQGKKNITPYKIAVSTMPICEFYNPIQIKATELLMSVANKALKTPQLIFKGLSWIHFTVPVLEHSWLFL